MTIEIRGAGFVNKGAELMLLATLAELRRAYPDAAFSMVPSAPDGSQAFDRLTALGMYPKSSLIRFGIEFGRAAAFVPRRLRRRYGLVLDREIDVVIDASGFAHGDQWGEASTAALARAARRWRRRSTRLILLPQAFGPFTGRKLRRAMRQIVNDADLVMPRDAVSYGHLIDVAGERDYIRRFPDFTNLIAGVLPDWFDPYEYAAAIVPNVRMLDKTGDSQGLRYVSFLRRCTQRLMESGIQPFLLVHEGAGDRQLAQRIAESCGGIPVLSEVDPLKIKGIIGACRAVVASRFHALVSALSQGVPALASGWSHKYGQLFEDYGFPEGVLPVEADDGHIDSMVNRLTDAEAARHLATQLRDKAAGLEQRSEQMWREVHSVIRDGRA